MKWYNVYFRIESGYKWGEGMSEEAHADFNSELKELFGGKGFRFVENSDRHTSNRIVSTIRGTDLYAHPMDISGVVAEEDIPVIEERLKRGKTFEYIRTDIYDELMNWDDYKYIKHLEEHKDEIQTDILEACKTKRRNLYMQFSMGCPAFDKVDEKWRVKRTTNYMGRSSSDVSVRFIYDVFKELVEQAKIVTAETRVGTCYRTAK